MAREYGESLGRAGAGLPLLEILERHGFEPRLDGDDITLANCPFRRLAADYTQLVCTMNLNLLAGLAATTGTPHEAQLAPAPGHCCVRLVSGPPPPTNSPPAGPNGDR